MIEEIIKSGMYAPSAVNKQPWHFLVFNDLAIIDQIALLHPNAQMIKQAAKAILICGDEKLAHAPGYLACDCSAATQNMLLTAHALGLGAVWVGIYPREERMKGIARIFNLLEGIVPFSIISLGYPDEVKEVPNRYKADRIHYENW